MNAALAKTQRNCPAQYTEEPMEPKQVIVVRKDLKMPAGKLAAQVAHASMAFLTRQMKDQLDNDEARPAIYLPFIYCKVALKEAEQAWLQDSFAKIVVWAEDLPDLIMITQDAKAAGLTVHAIQDQGRTCFNGPEWTCAAIGPDYPDRIDPITRHLKLVK